MNQSTLNDIVENKKVTVEDENSEEKNQLKTRNSEKDSINDATSSTSSTGEIIDVKISTKKKNLNIKPKKAKEEDDDKLYDPSKPITHRVEIAIKKFRKAHIFDQMRNQIFSSYLSFGGINPKKKSDSIEEDLEDAEVDFTYTVRAYLSGFIIEKSGYVHIDIFREAPRVVISFLNYLFENKVCPEYEDDMQEALRIAHKANDELPNCKALNHNAPGKFNKACSLLFGGELYGMLDDILYEEKLAESMIGISKEEGKQLIEKVFGANALKELTRVKEDSRYNLSCEIIELETFTIENHNQSTIETQGENSNVNDCELSNPNNNIQVNDETNLKKITLRECNVAITKPFYVSECYNAVNYAIPGTLITADFHKLSNGFLYWDNLTNIYPSYYLACDDDD